MPKKSKGKSERSITWQLNQAMKALKQLNATMEGCTITFTTTIDA